jgi:predicted DNA-binding transcriptional regulator AlpA
MSQQDKSRAAQRDRIVPIRKVVRETGIPFGTLMAMTRRGEFPDILEIGRDHFAVRFLDYVEWKARNIRVAAARASDQQQTAEGSNHD